MVKQVKISSFTEVKNIMNAASGCCDDIGVHDAKGSIADAKSILGLMSRGRGNSLPRPFLYKQLTVLG